MKLKNSTPLLGVFAWTSAMAIAAAALVLAPSFGHAGRNPNPGVLPIDSTPYGKSYGNWGAAWWAWGLSIPKDQNPLLDPDGSFAHVGQSGPVWFLAGNFGGGTVRTFTVPAGKGLFFPIFNNLYWTPEDLAFVKDVLAPLKGWDLTGLSDEEILRMGVNWAADHATALSVTIDGVPVVDPWQYRADSDPIPIVLSDLVADWGYTPGLREMNISDGYWIMLRPLTPGQHTIHITSAGHYSVAEGDPWDQEFSLDVTLYLTVK